MTISLREITQDNYETVCELEIPDDQQRHLSENVWSLVESHYDDSLHARAIYLDDEAVGFMMWAHVSVLRTSIWRFMVAYKHQKKGIGRAALEQAVLSCGERDGVKEVEICYSPENTIARDLYLSMGFKEDRLSDDGSETYAILVI